MGRVGRLMVSRVDGGLALYPRALQSPVRPLTSVVYRLVGRNARVLKSCAVGGRVRCRVLESSVRITRHSERAICRGCYLVPGSARTKTGMMVGRKSPCGKSSRIRNDNALASWDSHSTRPIKPASCRGGAGPKVPERPSGRFTGKEPAWWRQRYSLHVDWRRVGESLPGRACPPRLPGQDSLRRAAAQADAIGPCPDLREALARGTPDRPLTSCRHYPADFRERRLGQSGTDQHLVLHR
jgi:hypothetical protein